ncbi:MRP4 protein, partial [Acromyrmex heyeri]
VQVVKIYAWKKSFSQIVVVVFYFLLGLILLGESIVAYRHSRKRANKIKIYKRNIYSSYRYISRNEEFVLFEHQRLSDLPVYVKLQRVSANWISDQLPRTLCNINLTIEPDQLCAVVGAVGSGKSSILYLLLKELFLLRAPRNIIFRAIYPLDKFTNNPNLHISYSQEPWLFGGTVRDNILFGQSYDKARYMQIANVCALTKDFRQFPREVYGQADVHLLDDPLSAVDTRVARHLYRTCIIEYLHGKMRILVTHQLQFLKRTDHIVVGSIFTLNLEGLLNTMDSIYVYTYTHSTSIIACITTILFRSFFYMKVFMNSSNNLHIIFFKLLQTRMKNLQQIFKGLGIMAAQINIGGDPEVLRSMWYNDDGGNN